MHELVGSRFLLRPLRGRLGRVARGARRCRAWLETWEPKPEPGSADPVTDREAFRARCGRGNGSATSMPPTATGCSSSTDGSRGEVSLGSVQRGPFQMGYIGYWIDEALAGRGYVPEGVVLLMRHALETLGLHRLEAAIVPCNDASRHVAKSSECADEGVAERFLQIQAA